MAGARLRRGGFPLDRPGTKGFCGAIGKGIFTGFGVYRVRVSSSRSRV